MRRPWRLRAAAVIAVATLFTSGCLRADTPDPVSSTDLQNGLAQKLAKAGTPAKWVHCPNPLPSQVGATTTCDVTFRNDDPVTALLTTTQVDGGKADWEITRAQLSKDQVTKRVSMLTGVKNVDCDSGMSGQVGTWVFCRYSRDGVTRNEIVEVGKVNGLEIKLTVTPLLPAAQVQDRVKTELIYVYGREPDLTLCDGDLSGVVGNAIRCVVTYDNVQDSWLVTVTGVTDGVINFTLASAAPGKRPPGRVDSCPGCPG